jgi:PPOX class probable F420-dependent enzyme
MALDEDVRTLATGRNFAAMTTLFEDGTPQTQVMWVDADETHLLINTEVHRQKFRNVERDPRVTVVVIDHENPYRYTEVRGRVDEVVRGPQARDHIDACSQRYFGRDYPTEIHSERVILRIAPDRVVKNGF